MSRWKPVEQTVFGSSGKRCAKCERWFPRPPVGSSPNLADDEAADAARRMARRYPILHGFLIPLAHRLR